MIIIEDIEEEGSKYYYGISGGDNDKKQTEIERER